MKTIKIINSKLTIKVDDEDFYRMNTYKWYLFKKDYKGNIHNYATRNMTINKKQVHVLFHRDFFNLKENDNKVVDHIDNDGLNCQRKNMRVCTHAENIRNSKPFGKSIYKGVSEHFVANKYMPVTKEKTCEGNKYWRASISINKKRIEKNFKTEVEAALWYNEKAVQLHGSFARLNNITHVH